MLRMHMAKLRIMLGDFYHFNKYNTIYTPINIGYMASYTKKLFGSDVELHLFREAQKFVDAAAEIKPHLVALSLYYWNTDLDRVVIQQLSSTLQHRPFFVAGGPSIDTIPNEQKKLVRRLPGLDAIIPNEGEVSFTNLVRAMLSDPVNFSKNPIDGMISIKGDELIKTKPVHLLDLGELPSPYLEGFLDEWTQAPFKPAIQTLRGCPFACKFCVSGRDTIKIRKFPMELIKAEIEYIAHKYKNDKHIELQIVDDNFGLFPRDIEIAQQISDTSEKIGFPQGVKFFNSKQLNKISYSVLEAIGKINKIGLNISLQTDTPAALEAMGRKNLTEEKIKEANDWAQSRKIDTTTELIFGLPGETKDSFLNLLERSVNRGFDNVLCHNLFLLDGSELNRDEERKKHSFVTKYRLPGTDYGDISGEFVAEYEEVVIGSNTFNYNDYMLIRHHNFFYYAVYALRYFRWFFHSLKNFKISSSKFFNDFLFPDLNQEWPEEYLSFLKDLREAFEGELYNSPEDLKNDLKAKYKANNNQVVAPTRLNILFGGRLIYMEQSWIKEVLTKHLENNGLNKEKDVEWKQIQEVMELCLKERINIRNLKDPEPMLTLFDYVAWAEHKFKKPLNEFKRKSPKKVRFLIDNIQKNRIALFEREQGKMEDFGFYYKALDAIVPRTQLLFNIESD